MLGLQGEDLADSCPQLEVYFRNTSISTCISGPILLRQGESGSMGPMEPLDRVHQELRRRDEDAEEGVREQEGRQGDVLRQLVRPRRGGQGQVRQPQEPGGPLQRAVLPG